MFVKGEQIMYSVFEQLLQEKGVSRYQVSKETGIPQTTLSTWKSRGTDPSVATMKKLADYFGVTMEYLTTGKDDSHTQITPRDWNEERKIGVYKDMTDEEIAAGNMAHMMYIKDSGFIEVFNHLAQDEDMKKRLQAYYTMFTKEQREFVDMIVDREMERGHEE